jgi:hypothetical protein
VLPNRRREFGGAAARSAGDTGARRTARNTVKKAVSVFRRRAAFSAGHPRLVSCTSMRRLARPLVAMCSVVYLLVSSGCRGSPEPKGDHPKLAAMRAVIDSSRKRVAAGASRIHHSVSICPTNDDGLIDSSGGDDLATHRLVYSSHSIGRADVATVVAVVERPQQAVEIIEQEYVWDRGQWVEQGEWFERHHPEEARAVRGAIDRLLSRVPPSQPSTAASE